MKFDQEFESERIRREAEEILRRNEVYKPSIVFFNNNDELIAKITIRPVEGPEDKQSAFAEAMLLVPYFNADWIILSFDDFVSTKAGISPEQDPDRIEAVVMIYAEHAHALGVVMPYYRDDYGNFLSWGQKRDDLSPVSLDGELIGTMSHVMTRENLNPPYTKVMVQTLIARGHEISRVEDGQLVPA